MSTGNKSDAATEIQYQDVRLVNRVLNRLGRRAKLFDMASEIHTGLTLANDDVRAASASRTVVVGEGDPNASCGSRGGEGGEGVDSKFYCERDTRFAATACEMLPPESRFSCTNAGDMDEYNGCGGAKFNCEAAETQFSCGADGGTEVFDCLDFACKNATFDCDTVDFQCGADFTCDSNGAEQKFECTGEHVFVCWTNNICVDMFECAATGDVDGDGDVDKDDCMGNYKRKDAWPSIPGGGGDQVPGDFLCGDGNSKNKDTFTCQVDFDCEAGDEFDCTHGAKFDCGQAGSGEFDCTSGVGGFECDYNFHCLNDGGTPDGFECTAGKFHCRPPGSIGSAYAADD